MVATSALSEERVLGECVAGSTLLLPYLRIVRDAKRPLVESWTAFGVAAWESYDERVA